MKEISTAVDTNGNLKSEPQKLIDEEEREYQRSIVKRISEQARARVHLNHHSARAVHRALQPRGCFQVRRG